MNMKSKMNKLFFKSEFFVFLIIIIFALLVQVRSGQFFSNTNMINLLRSMTVPLIYGLCAYLGFISTGADVSFPLIAALSTYMGTIFVTNMGMTVGTLGAFIISILFGLLLGFLNGFLISNYDFPSLIVTLGTSTIFSGILFGVLNAGRVLLPTEIMSFVEKPLISVTNPTTNISAALPKTFIIALLLYLAVYLVLNYTIAGRGVFAIGGDSSSAERAGFNVKLIRTSLFTISGGIAAIAGMCYALETKYFLPTEYVGGEMTVIAAVVLGGTSMASGKGSLTGVFLGTLLLTMVSNSLMLIGVPIYWQRAIVGLIIVVGTAISVLDISKLRFAK